MSVQAYVSYSCAVEKETQVVAELKQLCHKRRIELIPDSERLKYRDSIPNFMRTLASNRWVFVVLSRQYFESPYCMNELLQTFKRGHPERRVLPVRLEPLWIGEGNRDSLINSLVEYWDNKVEQQLFAAVEHARKGNPDIQMSHEQQRQFATEVRHWIPKFIHHFETLALPEILPLPSAALRMIVECVPVRRPMPPDSEFVADLKLQIAERLSSPELVPALQRAMPGTDFEGEVSLVEHLALDPNEVLVQVLIPAYQDLRRKLPRASFEAIWSEAKDLLGAILLLSVSEEWLRDSGLKPDQNTMYEIAVQTGFGVEIVSARLRQVKEVRLNSDAHKSDVTGAQRVVPPEEKMPKGWSSGNGGMHTGARDLVLVAIWDLVFPDRGKNSKTGLSPVEMKKLKSTLEVRERLKSYHYYLQVELAESVKEDRKAFCTRFAELLPELPLFMMGFGDDGQAIFSTTKETDLEACAREFLEIPNRA